MTHPFIPPKAPIPPDRQLEPECDAITKATIALVEQIMMHYPEQAKSMAAGVNVRVYNADGVDHLMRLASE